MRRPAPTAVNATTLVLSQAAVQALERTLHSLVGGDAIPPEFGRSLLALCRSHEEIRRQLKATEP